jgi:glucokinase
MDFGGSHVSCAVVSGKSICAIESLPVPNARLLAPLLTDLAGILRQLAAKTAGCTGVAVSFCGIVDPYRARILSTPLGKYDDAKDLDLRTWSREQLGLPLAIENDARMALLGERHAGAAQGWDDVVMVTLGTGVGGAAMIDGRLLRGKHFQAGCLGGHLGAKFDGRGCVCGAVGCVEAEASGWALPEICRAWPGFAESMLAREGNLNFAQLFDCARAGDRVAAEIVDRSIRVWAAGLVGLIHAYDPELIVVGGAVMGSADRILPALQQSVQSHAWTPWGTVGVRAARLGNQAALLGAVPLLAGSC